MKENKNGANTASKPLSLFSSQLPKIQKNNLSKSSFKPNSKPKIHFVHYDNENMIKNFFSTRKINSNLTIKKNGEKDKNFKKKVIKELIVNLK